MSAARQAAAGEPQLWESFLSAHSDPSKPALPPEDAQWARQSLREASGLDAAVNVMSDFEREARLQGGQSPEELAYQLSPKEMIARAASSHFHALGSSPGLAWAQTGDPRGREAETLSRAYQALARAVAADPVPLANDRARAALRQMAEPASPAPPALDASTLASWRRARAKSASDPGSAEARPARLPHK